VIINESKKQLNNLILWIVFVVYIIVAGFGMLHHELWGDEIHSWNIAKASGSFVDLISNTRYEGHPPLWYIILWTISKFTHDPEYIQLIHFVIACLLVFLILFFSPFPISIKTLIPFGYFFLFEYSVLSRNYAVGILFAFCICIIIHKSFIGKLWFYYGLLFLQANTHLFALLLAASFHLYFLQSLKEQKRNNKRIFIHFVAGSLILLFSLYFIFPPPDSSLEINYWLNRWNVKQLSSIVQSPLRAFVPIPAWWEYHFWNTQFLIEAGSKITILKWLIPLLSATLVFLAILLFRKNRKSIFFFLFNLFLIILVSFIIPLANARHVGFIFIGFIVALWLYANNQSIGKNQTKIILLLLIAQMIGGIFTVFKDINLPFSNGNKANELLKEIPPQFKIVTDYWCLNTLSAFTDKSYYCVDLQKEISYLLWNSELDSMLKKTNRYSNGISAFFKTESLKKVYMISIHPLEKLNQVDKQLSGLFHLMHIDKRDDAIEKGGNLYLYEITTL